MRPQRPKRRTVRVGFRLTRAEKAQIRQCAQKGELFSETCRRLLLFGCAQDQAALRASQQFAAFGLSADPES